MSGHRYFSAAAPSFRSANYFRLLQAVLEAPAVCAAFRHSVLELYLDASNDAPGALAWFGALELPVEPIVEPLPDPVPIELLGAVVPGAVVPGALVPGLH